MSSLRGLSWQITAVFGLALLSISLQLAVTGRQIDAQRAAARAAGLPEVVSLAAFDPARDIHPAGEVHLAVRIDPAAMIGVTQRLRGADGLHTTQSRRLYPLQDATDRSASALVRGAVLLTEAQVGDFLELIGETGEDARGGARIVSLNGLAEPAPPLAEPALAALRQLGLEPTDDFVFVMPFLKGRNAFLADHSGSWNLMVALIAGAGGAMIALALGKLVRRQRRFTALRRNALPAD